MGEAVYAWGQGLSGKFLYLPVHFAVNLKLFFKKSLKKKKEAIRFVTLEYELILKFHFSKSRVGFILHC